MGLRIAKQLMRFILFAFLIQFVSPVLVYAGKETSTVTRTGHLALNSQPQKSTAFLVLLSGNLFEEKEGEGEGETKVDLQSFELVDFVNVVNALTTGHSNTYYRLTDSYPFKQTRCSLHCILII